MLTFIRHLLGSALKALFVLGLLLILFVGYRVLSADQEDDALRIASKQDYLDRLAKKARPANTPNIVFFLYDDLGYGDIGAGAADNALLVTPHIDRLASNGVSLTDFHSPSPICTPSRAAYLTGRLAPRAGLPNVVFPSGSLKGLLFNTLAAPELNTRLPAEEITLADILKASGFATAMVGKWHLGDHSPSLPNDMGFEFFYGALYSNDMEPFALYHDREVVVPAPVDQRLLTELYTKAAKRFIEKEAGSKPFFLYFAHNFPHDPLHVRDTRRGQSDGGLYGDVLSEIDDSVGVIIDTLKRQNALDNTLIIMTSDNGPWFLGDAGNQRGRKGNTFEGGMRVPFIAHWPAAIEGGRSETAMAMGTDLVPTVLELLQLPFPNDRQLDGRSVLGTLLNGEPTPHDYLYYYEGETLFAVRDQRFKYRGAAGVFYSTDQMPVGGSIPQKEWLFDLRGDPRESYDTSDRHPRDLERLRSAFLAKQQDMLDNPRGWQ